MFHAGELVAGSVDPAAVAAAERAAAALCGADVFSGLLAELPVAAVGCRAAVLGCFAEEGVLHSARLAALLTTDAALLSQLSALVPFASKRRIILKKIAATMDHSEAKRPNLELNRLGLRPHPATGRIGPDGTSSVFAQVMVQMAAKQKASQLSGLWLRPKQLFKLKSLAGEGIDDAGGGYAEMVSHIMLELQVDADGRSALPLLLRTPNGKNADGENRDTLIFNPEATAPIHMQMYTFLGKLVGSAVRTDLPIDLPLAAAMWDLLLGRGLHRGGGTGSAGAGGDEPGGVEAGTPTSSSSGGGYGAPRGLPATAASADSNADADAVAARRRHRATMAAVRGCRAMAELDGNAFRELERLANIPDEMVGYEESDFQFPSASGVRRPILAADGSQTFTPATKAAFIAGAVAMREAEFGPQVTAIRAGMAEVLPVQLLPLLTAAEFATMVCGQVDFDVAQLRAATHYDGYEPTSPPVQWFWAALQSFTPEEKSQFLRFTGGFTRLPHDLTKLPHRFEIHRKDGSRGSLPQSATCFFTLKLPEYGRLEELRARLKTAMLNCGAIDTDGDGGDFEVMAPE
jgi:hypothetical protein